MYLVFSIIPLGGCYYCFCFTEKETENQRQNELFQVTWQVSVRAGIWTPAWFSWVMKRYDEAWGELLCPLSDLIHDLIQGDPCKVFSQIASFFPNHFIPQWWPPIYPSGQNSWPYNSSLHCHHWNYPQFTPEQECSVTQRHGRVSRKLGVNIWHDVWFFDQFLLQSELVLHLKNRDTIPISEI